jgi:long-chain acyl-CoA synthetase
MLVQALLDTNSRCGSTLAVDDGRVSLTYRRLTRLALVFRRLVQHATDRPRVGIMLPASAAFPAAWMGTLWAGRVAVPLNFLLNPAELAYVMEDAELDLVITVKPLADRLEGVAVRPIFLEELSLKRRLIFASLRPLPAAPQVTADDTAVVLYTSGTTARPKGVELTHGNIHSNAADAIASLDLLPSHRFVNVLPPFHVFGLTGTVVVPILMGGSVWSIPRFSPSLLVRTVAEKQASVLMAVPSMYAAVLRVKSATKESFASMVMAISGGEPLSPSLREQYEDRFGVTLYEGYGLTETSPIVACNALDGNRPGTVGRPIRNVEVQIRDENGQALSAGQDGEIVIRGPGVMKGYYRQPEATALVLSEDGWFRTGDVGQFDEEGFLSITGRLKELLIIGGENVFPGEIEEVLTEHEAVVQAAVIGIADPSRGEIPVAFVTLEEGRTVDEAALRQHARARLAGFKVPRQIFIREELPTSPTGKILKRSLHELLPAVDDLAGNQDR